MFYLITAVLCSVSVSILLKVLRQRHIDIRQTIVAGYPVAFLLTWMLLQPDMTQVKTVNAATWGIILALGILLPFVFILLGRAIAAVGIIATDAAQRWSLIIPIVAAFVLFAEVLTVQRVLGIFLGFVALAALIYRPRQLAGQPSSEVVGIRTPADITANKDDKTAQVKSKIPSIVWLLGVWLGYGVIDILFKQVAKQGAAFALTLFISFGLAALLLLIYLLIQRIRWQPKALLSGLLLGVLNMGNIYAYIKAHQSLADSPSVVFTGMNVGVIALATLVGVVVFKESLNKVNMLGLGLAMACVLVLFLG